MGGRMKKIKSGVEKKVSWVEETWKQRKLKKKRREKNKEELNDEKINVKGLKEKCQNGKVKMNREKKRIEIEKRREGESGFDLLILVCCSFILFYFIFIFIFCLVDLFCLLICLPYWELNKGNWVFFYKLVDLFVPQAGRAKRLTCAF